MFDGVLEETAMLKAREIRISCNDCTKRAVERLTQSCVVAPYLADGGPILRLVIWEAAIHGIDAEGEELVEIGVKRRKPERYQQKIPIKGFEMAQIENNSVAF